MATKKKSTKFKPDRSKPVAKNAAAAKRRAAKAAAEPKTKAKSPAAEKKTAKSPAAPRRRLAGRTALPEADKRSWAVQLRFTDSEMEHIESKLAPEGHLSTVTGYLMSLIMATIPESKRRSQ